MTILKSRKIYPEDEEKLVKKLFKNLDESNIVNRTIDHSNNVLEPENWQKEFEDWREKYQKRKGPSLRYFELIPHDNEEVFLDEMQDLATRWIDECFSTEGQWVVFYREFEDTICAYVLLNALRPNGRRWNIDECDYHDISNKLNAIAESLKMRTFFYPPSPKIRLRSAIYEAVNATKNIDEFKEYLKNNFYMRVSETRHGDFYYYDYTDKAYSTRASGLGPDYTKESIERFYTGEKTISETCELWQY